jgi:prophage DNA circulation protein
MARDTATFRGVSFFVETADLAGGRKVVAHDYPFRDQAFVEDLGRRGRLFRIEGYVIGDPRIADRDDYLAGRDALIEALEQPGPGTLVHPYHGTRLVAVGQFSVREGRDEVRIAYVSIDFLETPASAFSPSADAAARAQVESAADATHTTVQGGLLTTYRVAFPVSGAPGLPGAGAARSLPNFVFTSVAGVLTSASLALHTALRPLAKTAAEAASFKRAIDALVSDATALVRDPLSLSTRLLTLVSELVSFPHTPRLGVQSFLAAARFMSTEPRPPGATITRQYEQVNYDETDAFLRRVFVTEAARQLAIASPSFSSYDEAITARDQVLEALDDQATLADDAVYDSLMTLRAQVARAVPDAEASLPRLVSYTPVVTVPSLVLAYRLYGAVARADELIARNHVRHPGFVVGGRALQVIANA